MKRWEQVLFGVSSVAILLIIGFKLHELDMPTARFVRSFNIGIVNRIGDLIAVAGQGEAEWSMIQITQKRTTIQGTAICINCGKTGSFQCLNPAATRVPITSPKTAPV